MTRDFVLASILLGISGTYYAVASSIPESQLADAVGARGLPNVYAILLAVLSLLLIARALRTRHRLRPIEVPEQTDAQTPDAPAQPIGRVAGLLAVGVIYIAIVPFAGYAVSIAALIVATAYYQGELAWRERTGSSSQRRQLAQQILLVGVAGAAVLWLVFVMLLRIPQPSGIWSSLW